MSCCHSFTCCAHSGRISSQCSAHSDLCRCLIAWTCKLHINTFLKSNTCVCPGFADHILQFFVIHFTHIRKTNAQFFDIRSDQRARNRCRNLICDQHQISRMKVKIHTSCCVGQHHDFCSQHSHQTYRKYHILHRVSLIEMHSSLHCHNRDTFYITK